MAAQGKPRDNTTFNEKNSSAHGSGSGGLAADSLLAA